MRDGYVRLWNRPYIWKERGALRWPGVLEVTWGLRSWNISLELSNDCDGDEGWPWCIRMHFLLFGFFLHLPGPRLAIITKRGVKHYGEHRTWGFTAFFRDNMGLHLHWNACTKVLWWPWNWDHHRIEVRRADGSWVPYVPEWESCPLRLDNGDIRAPKREPDGREVFLFNYAYTLKSGEVQRRKAKVHVERMFHRRRWMKWTAVGERCHQYIDFRFDGEVGEDSGSWKGGVIGTSETMLPGETAEQTFRRMERTRKFGRCYR